MESPDKHILPVSGRLLGIDFGTVRIGVAISDANQKIASPLETYTRRNAKLDAEHFTKLVKQESVVGIVVGLPVHMSGDESKKSLEVREFGTLVIGNNHNARHVDRRTIHHGAGPPDAGRQSDESS